MKMNHILRLGLLSLFCCSLISITIIRAATTSITYDEAYTYLRYADPHYSLLEMLLTWLKSIGFSVLNNHWFNSILVYFFSKVANTEYNEFLMRLPNIVAGCIYLAVVLHMYNKRIVSLPCFILLSCNYFLMEFFGLARGYGLASMFVLVAIYFYIQWARSGYASHKHLNLHLLILLLAYASNTIALFLFPGFLLVEIWHLVQGKGLKDYVIRSQLFLFIYFCISGFLGIFTVWTSRAGQPIYSESGLFRTIIKGFSNMYIMNELFSTIAAVISVIILISAIMFLVQKLIKARKENILDRHQSAAGKTPFSTLEYEYIDLLIVMAMTFLMFVLMDVVLARGLPATRELLPFFPLAALVFMKSASMIKKNTILKMPPPLNANIYRGFAIVFIAAVLLSFISQIDTRYTQTKHEDYVIRDAVYISLGKTDPADSVYPEVQESGIELGSFTVDGNYNPAVEWYARQASYRYDDVDLSHSMVEPSVNRLLQLLKK